MFNVIGSDWAMGQTQIGDAAAHPFPDAAANAFVTDPPYYDAVPYADLADFFYVWLKRTLPARLARDFIQELSPKEDECIVDEMKGKDKAYFEQTMQKAMAEGRRIVGPGGIGTVVFAHKTTAGWEAQLNAMVDAGWVLTGSWPIDTEMGSRLRAMNSAALASSIHLVCRPRDDLKHPEIGDWRDVLDELPRRIHQWLPRLAEEGVVGADAIFACLGPALEVFSRYSRVEKVSGEKVSLGDYLAYVWGAVSKEAVSMIFSGGDASGFEEDARLTAMWLWTLSTADGNGSAATEREDSDGEEAADGTGKKPMAGFVLEYDAARKIAQGLGAHLETMPSLVEIKGETARLLPVGERANALFGKGHLTVSATAAKAGQFKLFEELEALDEENDGSSVSGESDGHDSFLDRLHRAMILFAAGRGEVLKRFLAEGGAGTDQRFWRLAQALSALYPPSSDEKRWVDGVMARKKSLGL